MRVITATGQDAATWTAAIQRLPDTDPLDLLGVGAADRVVVVVPHPDDETLALGGTMQRLARAGVVVELVVATDGEAAYGRAGPDDSDGATSAVGTARAAGVTPRQLAGIRRAELAAALARLRVGAQVTRLGMPDGRLADHEDDLRAAIEAVVRGQSGRTVLLAPWEHDPHPDHRAAGRAALSTARRTRTDSWAYPVWLRHAYHPEAGEVPWAKLRRVTLDPTERTVKRTAIAAYESQIRPPSQLVEAVLPDHVLAHFGDGDELLVSTAPDREQAATHFDAAYAASTDPWSAATSWYEQRKRAVLMSALPRSRYRSGWEPACSVGLLTAELAARCDRIEASDVSDRAVAAARAATQELPNVRVDRARLPDDPPPYGADECDLVVLSEVLYYLAAADRCAVLELARRLLAPDGHLVVAHWRGHPYDAHCSGEQANAEVVAAGRSLVQHCDERFVLDIVEVG